MYETRKKRCRRCKRVSTHWRDLPDMPTYWTEEPGLIPYVIWARLTTSWKCRGCHAIPMGPLEFDFEPKPNRGGR